MIDSVAGIMNAAPMPWTARPATSQPWVGREADRRAREREHHHAEQEHPPAPEDVAEPAAGDEQHGERQRVGVDRPLERRDRRAEVALDGRQRDVHDRVVEHDHEQGEAHRRERPPAAVALVQANAVGHGGSPQMTGERACASEPPRSAGSSSATKARCLGQAAQQLAGGAGGPAVTVTSWSAGRAGPPRGLIPPGARARRPPGWCRRDSPRDSETAPSDRERGLPENPQHLTWVIESRLLDGREEVSVGAGQETVHE